MTQTNSRSLRGMWAYLAQAGYALLLIFMIGLAVAGMPPYLAEQARGYINVDFEQNGNGEVVLKPIAGYDADKAGIKAGDVMLAVNGTPVPAGTAQDQAAELVRGNVGETLTLTIRSADGSEKTLSIIRSEMYLQTLASIGLNNSALIILNTCLELGMSIAIIAISLWVFLKDRRDWLMLVGAGLLLILPAGMGVVNIPLAGAKQLGILPLYELMRGLTLGLAVLFLFVFPNGKFFPRWIRGAASAVGIYAVAFGSFLDDTNLVYTWIWVAFFLMGVYSLVVRTIRDSTPGEKKQTLRLLYGTVALIIVYVLITIYNNLPGASFSWATWIILNIVRNALMTAGQIFFAYSLARSLQKVE